jgi:glyoxylase-like metal-dependent hydrolase (beta-lactamase superfamily II)
VIEIPQLQEHDGIVVLDSQHAGNQGTIAVFLIPHQDGRFALIETCAGSTLPTIKRAINQAGFELSGLSDILLTHIHLDHAGAAGALAQETGAKVYVHERGYKHLHDPSRLIDSASRIYGELMDSLWGTMVAIPKTQLVSLSGGERLKIVDRDIRVLYTPGHASHHVSYMLDDDVMFTGDAAAVKHLGSNVVRPALPPPEVNLELWQQSLTAMRAAKPSRLMLTHFGEVSEADEHLAIVHERNQAWADEILKGMLLGESNDQLVARIGRLGSEELEAVSTPPEVKHRHELTSNYAMTTTGLVRYWQKHHPERVEGVN